MLFVQFFFEKKTKYSKYIVSLRFYYLIKKNYSIYIYGIVFILDIMVKSIILQEKSQNKYYYNKRKKQTEIFIKRK